MNDLEWRLRRPCTNAIEMQGLLSYLKGRELTSKMYFGQALGQGRA